MERPILRVIKHRQFLSTLMQIMLGKVRVLLIARNFNLGLFLPVERATKLTLIKIRPRLWRVQLYRSS
jgi:hypothetical protein